MRITLFFIFLFDYNNLFIVYYFMLHTMKDLDITEFQIDVDTNYFSHVAIIGLGATGSSFLTQWTNYLRHNTSITTYLLDHDTVSRENLQVYFNYNMLYYMKGYNRSITGREKTYVARRFIKCALGDDNALTKNNNKIHDIEANVNFDTLERIFGEFVVELDYIFMFTDNNASRYEIYKYQKKYKKTIIIDVRVGTYDQVEVIYSANAEKYLKTIYLDEGGEPRIVSNRDRVCLEDRMSFSIASVGASLAMNLFLKIVRDDINKDFKHIMIGRDYIGDVRYE